MVIIMASLFSTPSALCSTSTSTKSALFASFNSTRKTYKVYDFTHISLLGLNSFSQWSGLKNVGISITPKSLRKENKGRCKGKVVYASLFGVGAPEALVIGVVALLVFGPKGLAEVARNLGKTLRAFQPTIRELQDVSREFKSTLEKEIGLDEISSPMQNTSSLKRPNIASNPSSVGSGTENPMTVSDPNGSSSPKAYTTEEYLKITGDQLKASAAMKITEEQLKASAAMQESQTTPPEETKSEPQTPQQATVTESTGATTPPLQKSDNES